MGTVIAHLSRDRRLEVRLTESEYDGLRETARNAGLSMSALIRMHLPRAAPTADRRAITFERAR